MTLWFNPALPEEVKSLAFNILYRQHWLRVTIQKKSIRISSRGETSLPINLGLRDKLHELQTGGTIELDL